jgi:hypothetical protein
VTLGCDCQPPAARCELHTCETAVVVAIPTWLGDRGNHRQERAGVPKAPGAGAATRGGGEAAVHGVTRGSPPSARRVHPGGIGRKRQHARRDARRGRGDGDRRAWISRQKCTSSTVSRHSSSTTRTSRSLRCCSPSRTTVFTVSSSMRTWNACGIWIRTLLADHGSTRAGPHVRDGAMMVRLPVLDTQRGCAM